MISAIALLTAAASPQAEPGKLTLQQQFNQSTDDAQNGKCIAAIPQFEALEANPAYKAESLPAAIITVLKGQCLIKMGREAEGEALIQRGLPRLRQEPDKFKVDIASALLSLGDAAMERWDYAGARRFFEEAGAMPGATHPIVLNTKLAQATAFDGDEAPLRYADAAVRAAEQEPGLSKNLVAEYRTLRARILLNQGRNQEGYAELKEVMKLTGKLDLSVSLADVSMRGDLALAAQLNGDDGAARKYLAYTGAGRVASSPFARATNLDAPICGMETGLRPDDFAVVDFAISPQGRVISARTVYTRGTANVASQFAQAVSRWSWEPEALRNIPPFFLLAPRIELRCTAQGQQAPGILSPLTQRFQGWALAQLGLTDSHDLSQLRPKLDALAAISDGGAAIPSQIAALGLLSLGGSSYPASRYLMLDKAVSLSGQAVIPPDMRNALLIGRMDVRVAWGRNNFLTAQTAKLVPPAQQSDMLALLGDPQIANDPLAADTVRLLGVEPLYGRPRPDAAAMMTQLGAVAADTRLPDRHPLRQVANLRLANLAARRGDYGGAQGYFAATGLTEEQCAYLGVTPAVQKLGIDSNDFPLKAASWGFEGWVQLEYDIGSDGSPSGIRPIISYPPFVFSQAAVRSARSFRFETSYRPSGGPACSADRKVINYRLR